MQAQSQCLDRISALPQDTIEHILSLIPLPDAVRTSILSSKWRYSWTNIPKLVFDDEFVDFLFHPDEEIHRHKLVGGMFHILLLHKGPISELCICMADSEIMNNIVYEMDQIILHLSWSKSIKKFTFDVTPIDEYYKLPCSFFSLKGIEYLYLKSCEIDLPLRFNGFSMLKSLAFNEVEITANMLQRFLKNCPLLEEFTLIREEPLELTKCEYVELLKCLPSIQILEMSQLDIMYMDAGGMPHKLPILLPQLRILVLEVCFLELSFVLCMINSSPNLEKIKIELCWEDDGRLPEQTFNNFLNDKDYMGLNMDHLKELDVTNFCDSGCWMEFVKFIMAKSPMLKKTRIKLNSKVSTDEELKMLLDLLYLPFPRASPVGKFIMEH